MAGETLLLKNCRLVLPCAGCKPLRGVNIVAEDGTIVHVGEDLPSGSKTGTVVECEGLAAIPCLYNAHTHAAMTIVRGVFEGLDLRSWLHMVWGVERKLTPGHVYKASLAAALELAANGVCGIVDMYFYPEETLKAFTEAGLRIALGPVVMGHIDPLKALDEAKKFARRIAGHPLAKPVLNIHSVYTVKPSAIRYLVEELHEENIPLHIHVAETAWEIEYSLKHYGKRPLQLLEELGALENGAIIAHASWLSRREVELAAKRRAVLVNCPSSNMKLGSGGLHPMLEAKSLGATVAIGTDGPATNNGLDVLAEARIAALLQAYARGQPLTRDILEAVFQAATEGGSAALVLKGGGRIEPGSPADIVLIDIDNPWWHGDPLASLILSSTGRDTAYTIVAGRIVYSWEKRRKLLSKAKKLVEEAAKSILNSLKPSSEPPCSPPPACKHYGEATA